LGKKDVIPFDSGKSHKLIPAGDVEAARRQFEAPKREITISEIYSYYEKSGMSPARKVVDNHALIPLIEKKLPSLLSKYNTLEEMRRRTGADKTRRQLEASIDEMLSFPEGMKRLVESQSKFDVDYMMTQVIRRHYGKSTQISKEDEVHLATALSSEEITWLSVTKGMPRFIFEHHLGVAPAIVDHFWDGIEWGKDTLKYKESLTGQSLDTYEEAGLTGVRHDTVFVPFEPKFALAMKGIYYSYVADAYIFDRCFDEMAGSAMVSGDGKILQSMAIRDGCAFSDSYGRENRHRVNKFLSSLSLTYVLNPKAPWSGHQAVQLIGLLEKMPDVLFDRQNLAFIPSGKGVMFLDPGDLTEVVYVPFDPFVAHIAQNEIYHSSEAIDRENPLWNFLFKNIRERIRERNEKEKNYSTLEKLARRMKADYGVDVALNVEKYAAEQKVQAFVGGTQKIHYTIKMGYWDLFSIDSILAQIPKKFLSGVKKIERRNVGGDVYAEMVTGVYHRGSFHSCDGLLEITSEPLDEDDPDVSEYAINISGESYTYTMSHEIGHAVHFSNKKLWRKWKRLSHARRDFPPQKREGEFLTAYASTDPAEDFGETFACYMYFPSEFEALAAKHPVLKAKYDFMRRLFEGRVFEQKSKETIRSLRGPLTFDFLLRETLMGKDVTLIESGKGEEVLKRIIHEEERQQSIAEPKGPVIQSLDVLDEPEKEVKSRDEVDKQISRLDVIKVLNRVLKRALKRNARFVDTDFLELRIAHDADNDAALDIANSLACSKERADQLVARCRKALEDLRQKTESIDEEIDQIGKRPDLEDPQIESTDEEIDEIGEGPDFE